MPTSKTARREIDLLRVLEIVDIDVTMILKAIDLHTDCSISFWDALIVASAARSGCGILYSEDLNAGREMENVRVVNPFE